MKFGKEPFEIELGDFEEFGKAWIVRLPTPPYGSAVFEGSDDSAEAKEPLVWLCSVWTGLWPDLLAKLQEMMESYKDVQGRNERLRPLYLARRVYGRYGGHRSQPGLRQGPAMGLLPKGD